MPTITGRRKEPCAMLLAWGKRPDAATEEWHDELEELILAGWGGVPQRHIPANWREEYAKTAK